MKIINILKNIGAVIAGFVVVFVLSTVADTLLESAGIFPAPGSAEAYKNWMYILALSYRTIFTVVGGYVTAYLTPASVSNKMLLVWILAGIGFVAGTAGAIANWELSKGAEWYPVLLVIFSTIAVWFGGYLKNK